MITGTFRVYRRIVPVITWRVGPGLRYWFHPQLAVGALVGIGGDHVRQTSTDLLSDVATEHDTNTISTFSTVELIGRF